MSLTPRTAAVAWGPPQDFAHLGQLDLLRTMTPNVDDLRAVRAANPRVHIQMVVQLGEFLRAQFTDPRRRNRSIRQAYALLAHEEFPSLVVDPDDAPEAIRAQWWGLSALRLDEPGQLDSYLYHVGKMIGAKMTDDLRGLVQSVHIDTAAWTMPAKRAHLGLDLSGSDLTQWITRRCAAFEEGCTAGTAYVGGQPPAYSVNGFESYSLRLHAQGYGLENFGTRHYHVGNYDRLRDSIIMQMDAAKRAIDRRPLLGVAVNPIPYSYQDREDMLLYLRAHAILYVGLLAHAATTGVPVYWQVERDRQDREMWVPTEYPMVWQQIINGGWTRVRVPLTAQALVILERPDLTIMLSIDDEDQIRIHRTKTGG